VLVLVETVHENSYRMSYGLLALRAAAAAMLHVTVFPETTGHPQVEESDSQPV
jgi:hypothetical protein